MKKKIPTPIIISGLACLTIIELFALHKGIDGVLLSSIVAIIALTIGVAIPSPIKFK